eukprot:s754_g8.t1
MEQERKEHEAMIRVGESLRRSADLAEEKRQNKEKSGEEKKPLKEDGAGNSVYVGDTKVIDARKKGKTDKKENKETREKKDKTANHDNDDTKRAEPRSNAGMMETDKGKDGKEKTKSKAETSKEPTAAAATPAAADPKKKAPTGDHAKPPAPADEKMKRTLKKSSASAASAANPKKGNDEQKTGKSQDVKTDTDKANNTTEKKEGKTEDVPAGAPDAPMDKKKKKKEKNKPTEPKDSDVEKAAKTQKTQGAETAKKPAAESKEPTPASTASQKIAEEKKDQKKASPASASTGKRKDADVPEGSEAVSAQAPKKRKDEKATEMKTTKQPKDSANMDDDKGKEKTKRKAETSKEPTQEEWCGTVESLEIPESVTPRRALTFSSDQAWIANPDLGDIEVEEKYRAIASEIRLALQVSVGGRVKDPEAKKNIAKNIGSLEGPALMDLESGAFKAKKAKKEKSPSEQAVKALVNALPHSVKEITDNHVRNCDELVDCLNNHVPTVERCFAELTDMLQIPASQIDPNQVGEFIDQQKLVLKDVDHDVKDAKRRISAAKGPRRRAAPTVEANEDSESE